MIYPQYYPMNDPAWTINVLFICYIIFYLLDIIKTRNSSIYILVATLLLSLAGINACMSIPFVDADSSLRGYASFIAGMLISDLFLQIDNRKYEKAITYIMLFITGFLFLLSYRHSIGIGNVSINAILLVAPTILLLSLYTPIRSILNRSCFQVLGRLSLYIYMWHYFWLYITLILKLSHVYGLLVIVAGTMVTSAICSFGKTVIGKRISCK